MDVCSSMAGKAAHKLAKQMIKTWQHTPKIQADIRRIQSRFKSSGSVINLALEALRSRVEDDPQNAVVKKFRQHSLMTDLSEQASLVEDELNEARRFIFDNSSRWTWGQRYQWHSSRRSMLLDMLDGIMMLQSTLKLAIASLDMMLVSTSPQWDIAEFQNILQRHLSDSRRQMREEAVAIMYNTRPHNDHTSHRSTMDSLSVVAVNMVRLSVSVQRNQDFVYDKIPPTHDELFDLIKKTPGEQRVPGRRATTPVQRQSEKMDTYLSRKATVEEVGSMAALNTVRNSKTPAAYSTIPQRVREPSLGLVSSRRDARDDKNGLRQNSPAKAPPWSPTDKLTNDVLIPLILRGKSGACEEVMATRTSKAKENVMSAALARRLGLTIIPGLPSDMARIEDDGEARHRLIGRTRAVLYRDDDGRAPTLGGLEVEFWVSYNTGEELTFGRNFRWQGLAESTL